MNIPRSRLFWAVGLGHTANDIFMSMGPVLLAFISVNVMPISLGGIALILGLTQLVGAFTQPVFGLLADRGNGRLLGAGGVTWTVSMMLVALWAAQNGLFWLMVLAFILPALGSGAFHPVGAMTAAESDRRFAASNLSYFFLMGQMGLGLGPAMAGLLLNNAASYNYVFSDPLGPAFDGVFMEWGLVTPVMWMALFALPGILLMATTIPSRKSQQARKAAAPVTADGPGLRAIPLGAVFILVTMVALRSMAQPGSVNFIPVLFQSKGWSPAEYGLITSTFWLASGFAGVFFGNLADHYDRRWIIAGSLVVSAPAFFLLPLVNGAAAFALAIAAGALSGGSHSIIVVFAQSLLPGSKALASGLIMGLIFGMGAVGNFIIGLLSETIGLASAFQLVAGAVVAAALLALLLPAGRQATAEVELEIAEAEPAPTRA